MPRIRLTITVEDKDDEWGINEAVKLYGEEAIHILKDEIEGQWWRFYAQAEVKVEIFHDHSPSRVKQSDNSESSEHGNSVLPVQG